VNGPPVLLCADELAEQERSWAAIGFSMGAFFACHLAGRALRARMS